MSSESTLATVLASCIEKLLLVPKELENLREELKQCKLGVVEISERLQRLDKSEDIQRLQDGLDISTKILGQASEDIAAIASKNDALEASLEDRQRLSEEFYAAHLLQPLGKDLIALGAILSQGRTQEFNGNQDVFFATVLEHITSMLTRLGFEELPVREGDAFDPQRMRPVKRLSTQDQTLHGKVARIIQAGFQRGAFTSHAIVEVFVSVQG